MHDAKPGDIYEDANGKKWLVYGICQEPTVFAEELEVIHPNPAVRKIGGVNGFMWDGFKRISPR